MKNIKKLTLVTIIFCLFIFALTIFDFAALHDIYKDYISPSVLAYLEIDLSKELPDWTATPGEWSVVTFSLIMRFIFLILNVWLLIYYYRKVSVN